MGRRYVRDARGRFASKGYSGQTAGAGARLTATGSRAGGGSKKSLGNTRKTQTIDKPKGLKPAAVKPATKKPLARSGKKIAVGRLKTNLEMGRKGVVSMSAHSKSARSGDVADRKSERLSQIIERQSGITARRQINRAPTYKSDGSFDQSAFNLNQRKLSRSKALQQRLATAATGASMASAALSRRRGVANAAKKRRRSS